MKEFSEVIQLVSKDFGQVQVSLENQLDSSIPVIQEVGLHLAQGGGKRIRPLLTLLAAKACGYEGEEHVEAAVIMELIHTATLLHDDVVDNSTQRRGRPTANHLWGNALTVLCGDFLYARAFQKMTALSASARILPVIASATAVIAEGEVLQLLNIKNPHVPEALYFQIISAKTAKLFEISTLLGPLLGDKNGAALTALTEYGHQLGLAFQIADDLLDYAAESVTMGKNPGDDLIEGKATLPFIHALSQANAQEQENLIRLFLSGRREELGMVKEMFGRYGSFEYTAATAIRYADNARHALNALPSSPYKDGLLALCYLAVERCH